MLPNQISLRTTSRIYSEARYLFLLWKRISRYGEDADIGYGPFVGEGKFIVKALFVFVVHEANGTVQLCRKLLQPVTCTWYLACKISDSNCAVHLAYVSQNPRGVKVTTQLHLVSRLRMRLHGMVLNWTLDTSSWRGT